MNLPRIPLIATLALTSLGTVHAGDFGAAFAGGLAGGIIGGAINAAANARRQPQPTRVVVVKERQHVVHEHVVQVVHHEAEPVLVPAPAPVPVPAPAPMIVSTTHVVNAEPPPAPATHEITPQVMDVKNATDMPEHMKALVSDHQAAIDFVAEYLKKVDPTKTLADVSLFQYVKLGAFNYLVAKAQINTALGATEQGVVVDLRNSVTDNVAEPAYRDFLHSGNVNLLGEHPLNALD